MTSARTTMRRGAGLLALLSALLLGLTILMIPPASATEHCPDHAGNPDKVENAEDDGSLVLAEGTRFCLKKMTDATPIIVADGETTLYEYLVEYGLDGEEGEGPSYYVTYPDDPEDLCPEGTDNAGQPYEDIEDCDEPDDLCPEGTDNAGQPYEDIEDCDEPEDLCPEGTDNAGQPYEDIEDCDEPEETVAPAASIVVECDVTPVVTLDNTDSDVDVTFTVTGATDEVLEVTVPAGETDTVEVTTLVEDEDWAITITADGLEENVTAEGVYDCAEETTPPDDVDVDDEETVRPTPQVEEPDDVEVLPNVVEKPAPTPAPAVAAADELPRTGLSSTQMLLLSLLLMGLGAVMILGPEGRRES